VTPPFEQVFPFVFPVFFVGLWLLITTILSRVSGWPGLSAAFPDRPDEKLVGFGAASGRMGLGVNYNNCLVLTACRQGLRVGVWRIFGLFDRPFFVPWEQLTTERKAGVLGQRVTMRFGKPPVGQLEISGRLADKLAAAAGARWPEPLPAHNAPIVS